jgi:hypothetical protein
MKKILILVALSVPALAATARAQMPPMPQPGPEHAFLKADVGTWDATVEFLMMPGAPPAASKGTETVRMLGDFWQLSEFKGEMMGQPFEGLGTTGWDSTKKKYVGSWIDSMTPGSSTMEGTYDAATKTMKATMEGPDPTGAVTKTSVTTQWKDADTRVFTMYGPAGADGKAPEVMRITYKRRK